MAELDCDIIDLVPGEETEVPDGIPVPDGTPIPPPSSPGAPDKDGYCDTVCLVKLDIDQILDVYDKFNTRIRRDLQTDYDCKKINGATYADTWAKLISSVTGNIFSSIVALQNKETEADKLLKYAQLDDIRAGIVLKYGQLDDITASTVGRYAQVDDTRASIESKYVQMNEIKAKSCREDCLAETECNLKNTQRDKVQYEIDNVLPASVQFTKRQTCGFDDNKYQKMLEAQLNAWAMAYSSGRLTNIPNVISGSQVDSLYTAMINTGCDLTI